MLFGRMISSKNVRGSSCREWAVLLPMSTVTFECSLGFCVVCAAVSIVASLIRGLMAGPGELTAFSCLSRFPDTPK